MAVQAEEGAGPDPAPDRWLMAIRGFFSQNLAIGSAFGTFGMTVLPTQAKFGVSRGMATLGLPLTVLVMGLVSPFIARSMERFGLRATMLVGILLSGLGYVLLAFAPSIAVVLFAYAVPLGIGTAMAGSFGASVLASNWFQPRPGTAIGFVNTPLFIALLPMVALFVIPRYGLPAFFLCLVGLHVVLLPLLWGIRTAPAGVAAAGAAAAHGGGGAVAGAVVPVGAVLRRPLFWAAVVGAGGLNAVAITGISHLVAFSIERGVAPTQAALLLSLMGGASIVGAFAVGVICDRLDAARTLSLLAVGLGLSWVVLLASTSIAVMVPAAFFLGACGAGVTSALNTLCAQLFGAPSLARVLGLAILLCLPFTFCLPPLAGVLHDAAGSYRPVIVAMIGICAAMAVMFYATARIVRRRERVRMAVALA